jgi:hypothetical protein
LAVNFPRVGDFVGRVAAFKIALTAVE